MNDRLVDIFILDEFASPDRSGNPFVTVFGAKDWNV
jgi:hypothetical protein